MGNRTLPATVVAVAFSLLISTGSEGAEPDGFSEAALSDLLDSTTTRSISAPMGFSDCHAMIRRLGTAAGVAPVNIVDTTTVRMVRFRMAQGGSLLVTCSANDRKAVLTRSFE